jgi:O-antigen/teichoic acid export membrane protein
LGTQYSYIVLYADKVNNSEEERQKLTSSSISILLTLFFGIISFYFFTFKLDFFPKYNFKSYYLLIVLLAILQQVNAQLVNISRVQGKILGLNLYNFIVPFFQLIVLFFFKEHLLFFSLLYCTIAANVLGTLFFLKELTSQLTQVKLFDFSYAKILFKRGLLLLAYNLTFYGMILAAKTIVSQYFSVEDFGMFNFANSISNSVFLLLGSLNFLFYPKLINLLSSKKEEVAIQEFIDKIRKYYLTLTLFIVALSIAVLPFLFYFLPNYKPIFNCLLVLLLGQLLINNTFGYTTLLVQRKKEWQLTVAALLCIIIIAGLSYFMIHYYGNNMIFISYSLVIGVVVYNIMIGYLGSSELKLKWDIKELFHHIFDVKLYVPVVIYVILISFLNYYIVLFVSFSFYFFLNYKDLKEIFGSIKKIIHSKEDQISIQ